MDSVFRRAAVRARIRANPLGAVLQRYVVYLVNRGHRAGTLHQYVFAAEHFGRWVSRRPVDADSVDRFIRYHLPRCRCGKPAVRNVRCVRASLNRLLEMLGSKRTRTTGTGLVGQLLRRYEHHLVHICGLSCCGDSVFVVPGNCEGGRRRRWPSTSHPSADNTSHPADK